MVAALLADLFESHRGHLLSVAYRLTGSVSAAEDAVQESWLRLGGVHQSEIEDLRAWLTTVVSRICLDHLRGAAVRRENYAGQWLPEPIVTGATPSSMPDPLESIVRKQECRLAAMVVLDTLTPPERVAFVLHDGLGVPLGEIADIIDVSVADAEQSAVRARKAMAHIPPPVTDAEHTAAVRRLLDALRTGDLDAITAALHPDSRVIEDDGGASPTAINVVCGRERIAQFFLELVRRFGAGSAQDSPGGYEFAHVNGQLGLVVKGDPGEFGLGGWPARVLGFVVRDGLVWGAYDHANPAKLTGIRLG
ncbi:RNA polymerase sigma factor SigJ [Nocardia arthritidis]|nr:RNA polymerase sigma factor SigJ [Nocardia arthritidis]